jgi:Ni/Fe-hydrogenase subunit HybB-like protein
MLETALKGSKKYWLLLLGLFVLHGVGASCFLLQLQKGLTITGMSRDVSWALYIAQFTFLVGVAASAVMVVLPYYLHNVKEFGKITILGEFLAVASVSMCLMFILVDMGKPMRAFNVLLNPRPNSILFWDMIVLNGYLFLNIIIGWVVLSAERKQVAPPKWIKPVIYVSIPWAVSIHTVTAFLYAGLPGRHSWLTAIMAARFLGSAFAAGPALLILLCLIVRKVSRFDPGKEAIQKLSKIVLYAMIISIFFVILELFTAFYSQIPGHTETFVYLFAGVHGQGNLVPWAWAFAVIAPVSMVMLLVPSLRHNETTLAIACVMVYLSLWIEKGITLVISGFIPNPFNAITQYAPTPPELGITVGVWAAGFLILVVLYKIAISVKEEVA